MSFRANTYTSNRQWRPEAAALSDGGFVITWQSQNQDGDGRGVYGQRFDALGDFVGEEFQVNETTNKRSVAPGDCGS